MLAHIAGIPVEETALSLSPIVAATGGIAGLKLRERVARRRAPRDATNISSPSARKYWSRRQGCDGRSTTGSEAQ